MIFTKDNLQGAGYSWLPESSNQVSDHFPTRKAFDRYSGDAMLRMLNLFNLLIARLTLTEGQTMELALARELPLQLCSETSVFNWLKTKYLYDSKIK